LIRQWINGKILFNFENNWNLGDYVPRTFISIDVNNEVIESLKPVQEDLKETGADLKLVNPQNIHMTLRFLGDVSESRVEVVKKAIDGITHFDPFKINLEGMGVFPEPSYIRVIWAGVSEGSDKLCDVKNSLESNLSNNGFSKDEKDFTPHFTIARVKSGKAKDQLNAIVEDRSDEFFGTVDVDSIELKKSELTSEGPIYSTISEFKF